MIFPITEHVAKRNDYTSFYLACGAADAPLIIFVHSRKATETAQLALPGLTALMYLSSKRVVLRYSLKTKSNTTNQIETL
jgi:hypothetical protein